MSGATPRITRSRTGTPLPALPTRQSHAYGAQGKASLSQQVTTSSADLNAAFTTTARPQRASARPSSQSATPAPAKKPRKSSKAPTPVIEEEPQPETNGYDSGENNEDEPEESDDEVRPGTSLQNTAAYINAPAVPSARPIMPPPAQPQAPSRPQVPEAFLQDDFDHEPWLVTVFFHTVPRFIQRLYGEGWRRTILITLTLILAAIATCTTVFFGALGLTVMPVPTGWERYRTDCLYRAAILFGVPGYNQPPQELNERWQRWTHSELFSDLLPQVNMPEYQWAINAHLLGRVETTENNTELLQQESAVQRAMIAELQEVLPKTIVVKQEDGEWSIPPLFWKAIVSKMESPSASPIWENFIEANKNQLRTFSKEIFAGDFDGMAKNHRLLTQEEFHATLTQHTNTFHDELDQTVRKMRFGVLEEARNVAKDVIEKSEIMQLARLQISALAHTNHVYNIDKKLREVNHFGIGFGAMIDPHYTSATKMPRTVSLLTKFWHSFGYATKYPNPPSMALQTWDEATDCWCAETSRDEKSKAQLTVKTPHKIFPTEITIEHIPAAGLRDAAVSAPKDFEVWVQVDSKAEATRINKANENMIPDNTSTKNGCKGKAPNGEKNWVCLAGEQYDIHHHNFVQTFNIWPDAQDLKIATERIAIRVLNNWGSPEHTCLYRVRAAGIEVGAAQQ
ncbi:putative SUN domain-containing protein 1-5 [Septoria linicola]|nr:putative SUN domain-containing protein 1-5 [Septoria linicola]